MKTWGWNSRKLKKFLKEIDEAVIHQNLSKIFPVSASNWAKIQEIQAKVNGKLKNPGSSQEQIKKFLRLKSA